MDRPHQSITKASSYKGVLDFKITYLGNEATYTCQQPFSGEEQGVTICTSPETITIQIVYIFFHLFCVSLVPHSTDLMHSHIPGDQEGPILFRLMIFFGGPFTCKLVYYILYLGYKFGFECVQICAKLYVTNLYITNLYQFNYKLSYTKLLHTKLVYINL